MYGLLSSRKNDDMITELILVRRAMICVIPRVQTPEVAEKALKATTLFPVAGMMPPAA